MPINDIFENSFIVSQVCRLSLRIKLLLRTGIDINKRKYPVIIIQRRYGCRLSLLHIDKRPAALVFVKKLRNNNTHAVHVK